MWRDKRENCSLKHLLHTQSFNESYGALNTVLIVRDYNHRWQKKHIHRQQQNFNFMGH